MDVECRVTETMGFFSIQILIFGMLPNNADVRRCSYFELGEPVLITDRIVLLARVARSMVSANQR